MVVLVEGGAQRTSSDTLVVIGCLFLRSDCRAQSQGDPVIMQSVWVRDKQGLVHTSGCEISSHGSLYKNGAAYSHDVKRVVVERYEQAAVSTASEQLKLPDVDCEY